MLKKQTKNVITREFVEKELRFYNTADIRYTSVILTIMALFMIPITVGAVGYFSLWCDVAWINALATIFVGSLFAFPVLVPLFSLIRSLVERKLLNRGDFVITRTRLLYKSDRIISRQLEELLHFEGFRQAVVTPFAYEIATPGDDYYIVHYKGKRSIKLFYSTKRYEYRC